MPVTRIAADLVRLLALVSAVAAFGLFGLEGGVRFTLVVLALLVPRAVGGGIPAPFDLAFGATLLLATWSATAGWYKPLPWIDWPVQRLRPAQPQPSCICCSPGSGCSPGCRDVAGRIPARGVVS